MGILEKISEIEKEIARTQKNKGKRDGSYIMINPRIPILMSPIYSYRIPSGLVEGKAGQV
jgi:hypothetical protein